MSDLKSVTTLIPNLQIGLSSTQAAFDLALRGIVSSNRTEFGDSAVAFHVDGFYSPRPQGATMLIHDMDRLEEQNPGTVFELRRAKVTREAWPLEVTNLGSQYAARQEAETTVDR